MSNSINPLLDGVTSSPVYFKIEMQPSPERPYFQRFEIAYQEVSLDLENNYLPQAEAKHRLWFRELIRGFRQEYEKWPTDPALAEFWSLCDRESPLTQLALCAFLHMTYDLARVIGSSLRELISTGKDPNEWFHVFHDADYTILQSFDKSMRNPALALRPWTQFQNASRYLVGNMLSRAFAFHIIMLRELAWRWGRQMALEGCLTVLGK